MKVFWNHAKERINFWWKKDEGVDGILVTVGLCIIALLLCTVMRTQLTTFVTTIMQDLTKKASDILATTPTTVGMIGL